jgi:deoxyadenosine/deoxycytidine kinase
MVVIDVDSIDFVENQEDLHSIIEQIDQKLKNIE